MKAKTLLLLALLAPLFTLSALADDPVEVGGIYYTLVPKAKIATVTKKEIQKQDEWGNTYTEYYSGSINIPSTITPSGSSTSYTVVGIEDNAFRSSSVTSVVIPESVTSIGLDAFSYCSRLTSVTIPGSITSIPDNCFWFCRSLTSIAIPNSVTSIGPYAFSHCSGLTSVDIPNSVTSIGGDSFYGCTSLTSVTIPNSITTIGGEAFSNCSSLTSVTIPESVTSIDRYAFGGCSSLTSITIPESVTSIDYNAFSGCSSLTSIVLPNVNNVGEQAFYGCTQLRSVTMQNNEDYTVINSKAFANCSNLEEFNIHSYKHIIEYGDEGEVYEYERIAKILSDAFENSFVEYASLHVPEVAIGLYMADATWSQFGTITSLGSASQYYKLFVDVNNKGKVVYGEGELAKTITGANQTFDVKEQEDIVLTLTPNDGYKLGTVTVNDVDKTAAVVDGVLTIANVNANQNVSVEFVLEGTSVTVTIGELGVATFCSEEALDFSGTDDVKAYIVSAFRPSTGKVTLTRITDVPARTGIVLLGNAGTYDIPLGTGETYVVNMLVGVTEPTVLNKTDGAYSNFILANDEDGLGFYAVSNGTTLAAGKAYLTLPTSVLPSNAQSIGLRFDGTTGIRSLDNGQWAMDNAEWFTIDGRRLDAEPTAKGLYIVNGRKVIVK